MHNTVKSAYSVTPADFFAFFKSARIVVYGTLVNAHPFFSNIGGYFRLETKTVFAQTRSYLPDNFALEQFVARFHIRYPQIGEHIG